MLFGSMIGIYGGLKDFPGCNSVVCDRGHRDGSFLCPPVLLLWFLFQRASGHQQALVRSLCRPSSYTNKQCRVTSNIPLFLLGSIALFLSFFVFLFILLQMSDCDPEHVPSMKHETRMQIQHCNWQVLNCTTAANYYHALRRQVRAEINDTWYVPRHG